MPGAVGRQLRDGRVVLLREAGPGDIAAIARLYQELSPESFASRFQASRPAAAMISRLAQLGPLKTASIVAALEEDPEHLVGEARHVWVDEGVAELGIVVLDTCQGLKLGEILLSALVEHARQCGLERLRAIVSLANTPMLRLLAPYGWALAEATDGFSVACLEISVIGGMPGWSAGTAGRRILVERRGWFDNERVAALRSTGYDVRQCCGPRRTSGRACPLVTSGTCRLAEEADIIVPMLPEDDEDCAAVVEVHRRLWPHRLGM